MFMNCSALYRARTLWQPAPLALAGVLMLAGCGGGGSSPSVDPAELPVFVDGVVAKGPVSGARVCGVWIVAGVQDATTETCTTSSNTGTYTLQMSRRTGVLSIVATGGTWRNEATGAMTPLGTLRSAAPFDGSGNNLAAQVTALTEVMVQRALARGSLTAATVAAATSEVERTFGVTGLLRNRPADITANNANLLSTPEILYGLANAGVTGWMVERGFAQLPQALATLSTGIADASLYGELAAYRAGIRRAITSNPASGLNLNASAYAAMVPLDFGTPPPTPTRPPIVEQAGTQRFMVRWPLDDLFQRPAGVACVTNVPASVPAATVLAAMQAHAATYNTSVASMMAVPRCIGSGQSITVDWSQTSSNPWGTAFWGDEG
jgi:hypothetical protein